MVRARFNTLIAARRPEEALQLVRGQLPHHRDSVFIWALLCHGYLSTEKYPEAEEAGRQALALAPQDSSVRINLGLALFHQGKQADAVECAAQAVELRPEEAEGHFWLGHILLNGNADGKKGREAALSSARTALELDRETGDYYWLAARASSQLGNYDAARTYLADGLGAEPGHRALLKLGTQLSGGQAVVGDEVGVVRSLLAEDPMDADAHRLLRGQVFAGLRLPTLLPWLQAAAFCFLAPFVPAAGDGGAIPVAVALAVLFGWVGRRHYRRLDSRLPAGYLKEQVDDTPLAKAGLILGAAALLAVTAGTVWSGAAGSGDQLRWALACTAAAVLPAIVGRQFLLAGEERGGQRAGGGRYRRPDSSDSTALLWILGCLLTVLALLHWNRWVYAGAALLAFGLLLLVVLLGVTVRFFANEPSPDGMRAGLRTIPGWERGFLAGCAAGFLIVGGALSLSGMHLLQQGPTPQPLDSSPAAPEPSGEPVPQPSDFRPPDSNSLPPLPVFTMQPLPTIGGG